MDHLSRCMLQLVSGRVTFCPPSVEDGGAAESSAEPTVDFGAATTTIDGVSVVQDLLE